MSVKRMLSLALAVVMMLSLCACDSKEETGAEAGANNAGVAVQVEEVKIDTISTENKVSGKVVADGEHTIMVAASAKCIAVFAEAGGTVEAGDIICTLDLASTIANYDAANIGYQAAVRSYQDQKAILDKQVQLARDNVNNTKALFEIGAASQLEIDQAELALSQAIAGQASALAQLEAGIQSGKAGLEQLSLVLENVDGAGNVIAPVSGTLVSLSAVEGGYVSAAVPVAVIDGVGQMKITVSVSESLVPKLSIGDPVNVSVSAAGQSFSGTIRSVEKMANAQTKLYNVTVTVPAEVSGLLSGMFADVTFLTNTSVDTIVVPTEAILTSGNTQYVYVVEDNVAKYLEVTTGLTGSGVTEILTGLTEGQQLVTVGQSYLDDGDFVRIVSVEG